MNDRRDDDAMQLTDAHFAVLEFCGDPPEVMKERCWEVPKLGSSLLKAVQGCFPEFDGKAERLINDLYRSGLVTISPVTVDVYGMDLTVARVTKKGREVLSERRR